MSNQWNQQPPHEGHRGYQVQPPYGQQPQQPYGQQRPYSNQPGPNPYASMPQNDSSAGGVASGIYLFGSCLFLLLILGIVILGFIIALGVIFIDLGSATSTTVTTSTTTSTSAL